MDGEVFTGTAHAGHDFVGDEEDSAIATDFCNALCVALGGRGRAECGSDDGFENECGNGGRVVCREEGFKIFGAGDFAVGESLVKGTAIAEAWRDVTPLGEKRLIRGPAGDVAADGHGSEGASVVTLTAGDDAEFLRGAGFEMKLAGELDGGFRGFGAAGGEIDTTAGEIGRSEGKEAGGKFFG